LARQAIQGVLEKTGMKSLDSQQVLPVAKLWRKWVSDIRQRHPDFQFVYLRLGLEFDGVADA